MRAETRDDERLRKRIAEALVEAKEFLERHEYGEVIIKRLCPDKIDVITTRRRRCNGEGQTRANQ